MQGNVFSSIYLVSVVTETRFRVAYREHDDYVEQQLRLRRSRKTFAYETRSERTRSRDAPDALAINSESRDAIVRGVKFVSDGGVSRDSN